TQAVEPRLARAVEHRSNLHGGRVLGDGELDRIAPPGLRARRAPVLHVVEEERPAAAVHARPEAGPAVADSLAADEALEADLLAPHRLDRQQRARAAEGVGVRPARRG